MINYNLLTLFLTSFLAGSFVPLGSEVHLLYLYHHGEAYLPLLFYASLGNALGGMTCYLIGKIGGRKLIIKYLAVGDKKLKYWESKLENKSEWIALFAWLPFVGEVLAACLGMISNRWKTVFLYILIGKMCRYYIVLKLL